jgi:hypothetical protein
MVEVSSIVAMCSARGGSKSGFRVVSILISQEGWKLPAGGNYTIELDTASIRKNR